MNYICSKCGSQIAIQDIVVLEDNEDQQSVVHERLDDVLDDEGRECGEYSYCGPLIGFDEVKP